MRYPRGEPAHDGKARRNLIALGKDLLFRRGNLSPQGLVCAAKVDALPDKCAPEISQASADILSSHCARRRAKVITAVPIAYMVWNEHEYGTGIARRKRLRN